MCGIFGVISDSIVKTKNLKTLVNHSTQRGKDSSGLIFNDGNHLRIYRADFEITKLLKKINLVSTNFICGHSRLITNGLSDNQPVVRDNIFVLHNGIITNNNEIWENLKIKRKLKIDSEVVAGITKHLLEEKYSL